MAKRTITLTGRPPVTIEEDNWPLYASASYHDYDGEIECQANRHWRGLVKVRVHTDGRAIVNAVRSYASNWLEESDYTLKAGELLPVTCTEADMIDAIKRVHSTIDAEDSRDHLWRRLVAECVADFPAEELT